MYFRTSTWGQVEKGAVQEKGLSRNSRKVEPPGLTATISSKASVLKNLEAGVSTGTESRQKQTCLFVMLVFYALFPCLAHVWLMRDLGS